MPDDKVNALYAQSGGVTAVINASAGAVIAAARRHPDRINRVYAGRDGILGVLNEDIIDTTFESDESISALRHTPGGAFGSCRHKLPSPDSDMRPYARLMQVFQAHDIGYFFYNGGGDSQDTAAKINRIAMNEGINLKCVGIPKTVDNDLPLTDCCPGFGSAAKYIAVSVREAALDVISMAGSSTKVFILEVMGRHAGWLAAAAGLAHGDATDAPHIILFPEKPFVKEAFIDAVRRQVESGGYCVVVASEGIRNGAGNFISEAGTKDAFGHVQLGGVAPVLANIVKDSLGYKYHWAVADYLQRSARHIASRVDVEQACAVGNRAVELALAGESGVLPVIARISDQPYVWELRTAQLDDVANKERKLPEEFIRADGFGITSDCRRYLQPLIEGEDAPPYIDGVPAYVRLQCKSVPAKLPPYQP
ncbi:MAG: 6-phosphofructokinase [Candidatus Porifericomitaceae bacterium WSBS_2022_MAG_OTU9]